jgi:hypothetical protein
MDIPTAQEQQQLKEDAIEIANSIIQKRDASVKITSLNTQRFIVGELGSIFWYFVIAGLLLLAKQIQSNQVNILFIVAGFCITLVVLFIFGVSIIKLRQKQEDGSIKVKLIVPILLLSFVPYAFGLYLILGVGIYNLFTQFSFFYLPQAIIYAYLGYLVMKKVKMIQEIGMRISENK